MTKPRPSHEPFRLALVMVHPTSEIMRCLCVPFWKWLTFYIKMISRNIVNVWCLDFSPMLSVNIIISFKVFVIVWRYIRINVWYTVQFYFWTILCIFLQPGAFLSGVMSVPDWRNNSYWLKNLIEPLPWSHESSELTSFEAHFLSLPSLWCGFWVNLVIHGFPSRARRADVCCGLTE